MSGVYDVKSVCVEQDRNVGIYSYRVNGSRASEWSSCAQLQVGQHPDRDYGQLSLIFLNHTA